MIAQQEIQSETVRMLCIKEPYASLMLHGKVESRPNNINIRGLVLIVATKKPFTDKEVIQMSGGEQALLIQTKYVTEYQSGHAIAIARLTDCRPLQKSDRHFIDYFKHGCTKYGWHFEDVTPIEPIQITGFQGWRFADDSIKSQIKLKNNGKCNCKENA